VFNINIETLGTISHANYSRSVLAVKWHFSSA